MEPLSIGIDIGGTRTKFGLVNITLGELMEKLVYPTEKSNETIFLQQILRSVELFRKKAESMGASVSGIGIGVSGYVDDNGRVDSTYGFIEFMEDYPLSAIIEQHLHLPCYVDNDARLVALGEAVYGKGKGIKRVLVLTLGTGVGFGFIVNGIFTDNSPLAHMSGHIKVSNSTDICYCGKSGCLEALVSSASIINAARKLKWSEKFPHIPLTPEKVFELAGENNEDAKKVIDRFANYLRDGIYNYVNIFAPDIVILGGGISKSLSNYIDYLEHVNYLKPYTKYAFNIVISELEEEAGILGAAVLVKKKGLHVL